MSRELPMAPLSGLRRDRSLMMRATSPAMGASSSSSYLLFLERLAAPFFPALPPLLLKLPREGAEYPPPAPP